MYAQNETERLKPASMTKMMGLLLICEQIDQKKISLDDIVMISASAAAMGGSQVFLEVNEQMSVHDLLKSVCISSANDAMYALGEFVATTNDRFVELMNQKAKELNLENTHFVNVTGFDDDNHYTCAKDIALMTKELLKYEDVFNYTMIWMDSLRNGEFGLSNTNKLIRFYPGANGMKTGFTDTAGYCMSATAKRDDMTLIAVVMKADTSDNRFSDAKKLLDYGFANFSVYRIDENVLPPMAVHGGKTDSVSLKYDASAILLTKGRDKLVESVTDLPEYLNAPVQEGQVVGQIRYVLCGEEIAVIDITAVNGVERIGTLELFMKILSKAVMVR